ncbi:hypothetical protein GCM10009416_06100 [Craurococcus roseus]|uniref:Uncharacterized protein n=1 Tax=Craurococcus roseus TaxID=77585 RepID=A0ABP3PPN5_9PROT
MWRLRYALEQGERLRALPALARDLGAAALVLAVFASVAALPLVTVPAAALVLLPALLLTAVVFGRDSALLAALLAALAARSLPPGETSVSIGLLAIAALSGLALMVAALLEEVRRSRAEAETAHLRSDVTARHSAERVEAARQQLRAAETRLVEAERELSQARQDLRTAAARPGHGEPALEGAFRSEGGV